MSHFIAQSTVSRAYLHARRAVVRVRVVGLRPVVLQIDPDPDRPIGFIGPGNPLSYLAEGTRVLDPNGEDCPATGRFAVTLETMNPYHLLTDIW